MDSGEARDPRPLTRQRGGDNKFWVLITAHSSPLFSPPSPLPPPFFLLLFFLSLFSPYLFSLLCLLFAECQLQAQFGGGTPGTATALAAVAAALSTLLFVSLVKCTLAAAVCLDSYVVSRP